MKQIHTQTEPAEKWVIDIPEGGRFANPIGAFTPAGNSIEIDSWRFFDNKLTIDFGFDSQFGTLLYEYSQQGEVDPPVIKKVLFTDKKYIEVDIQPGSDVQVYELLHSNNPVVSRKITEGVNVTIRDDKAIIETNTKISGYILIK